MCTVSWLRQDGGYHLLCNRDEKLTRREAWPPYVDRVDGLRTIAPRDGDFGGTWIGVNEAGVSICLLNGPAAKPGALAPASRGSLVMDLLGCPSVQIAVRRIHGMALTRFAPFMVVALERRAPAQVVEWRGDGALVCQTGDHLCPLVSSSFDPDGVKDTRRREYAQLTQAGIETSRLQEFHQSHGGSAGPHSPCMHRHDAKTVSFSWITVTSEAITFQYKPGSPCENKPCLYSFF